MGMIPSLLAQNTSPIVDHALETGGRGSTVTNTDYGVIGDAMFKKSQLDLNIASLQAQTGIQEASLRSGLEMDRARLELQKADTMMNAQMNAYTVRQNIASDGEKILGSLGGALSGAATGFMVGGPMGAVVGAGVGGLATYSGYESGGRRGGQASQQILGNIASSASLLKGGMDAAKSKDALSTWAKTGAQLIEAMNAPNQTQEQRAAATAQYEKHLASLNSVGAELGWNPQQTASIIANQRKAFESGSSGGSRGGIGAQSPGSQAMRDLMFEASSDKNMQDPTKPGYSKARDYYLARANNMFQAENKGKSMTRGQAADFLDEAFPRQGIGSMFLKGQKGSSGQGTQSDSRTPQINQQREQIPQQAPDIQQQAQPQRTPMQGTRENTVGVMAPIANAPGVTLDRATSMEMFTQPVIAEQKLAQQGAEVVKDKTLMEKLTTPYTSDELLGMLPGNKDRGLERMVRETRAKNGVGANDNAPQREEASQKDSPKYGTGKIPEPNITSTEPEDQAKEKVFKTSTQALDIAKTLDMKGKYKDAKADDMAFYPKAAAEINKVRKMVDDPVIQNMTPEQRMNFQTWLQGNGPDAMKGSSKSIGGQGLGVGLTGSVSEFERSIKVAYEGAGKRFDLSKDQIKALYRVQAQIEPTARMVAMKFNKGTLTEQDVAGFRVGIWNSFESSSEINEAGSGTIQDMLWNAYQTDAYMSPTLDDDFNKKLKEAQMRKAVKGTTDKASDGWR